MNDWIKKKDVVELLNNSYVREDGRHNWRDHNNDCIDRLIEKVKAMPSGDAVSVVHGEWMPNPKIGWGETWVCSICGEKTTSSVMGYPRYNYCPICGAKMKGADEPQTERSE